MSNLFISLLCFLFISHYHRKFPLDPGSVPATVAGLEILAKSSAWRHVIELSNKITDINNSSTNNDESIISIKTRLRLEGLFRLKMFDELSYEVGSILTAERARLKEKKERLQNQTSVKENEVPNNNTVYAMELLLVEVAVMTGNGETGFQILHQLRQKLEEEMIELTKMTINTSPSSPSLPPSISSPSPTTPATSTSMSVSSSQWWSWRVSSSIINAAIRQRLWRIAVPELSDLLKSIKKHYSFNSLNVLNFINQNGQNNQNGGLGSDYLLSFQRVEIILMCRLARILLQVDISVCMIY